MEPKSPRGCLLPLPSDAFWAVDAAHQRISGWMIGDGPVTIGRASDCDVVVRDPRVSRRHAVLTWVDGRLFLTHASETNPTLLNGAPVPRDKPAELASTDRLQVGIASLEVLLWDSDDSKETIPHAPPRTLAVVLAADVAGYTVHWQRDEARTLQRFHECLRLFRQHAQRNRGRVLDTGEKGDCVYSLYHSVLLGLMAATGIRRDIDELNAALPAEQRIRFRYGMHCGDVVLEGEGIRGDAINTAAHLQAHTEPGEIIVSPRIQQEAQAQYGFRFEAVAEEGREIIGYRLIAAPEA